MLYWFTDLDESSLLYSMCLLSLVIHLQWVVKLWWFHRSVFPIETTWTTCWFDRCGLLPRAIDPGEVWADILLEQLGWWQNRRRCLMQSLNGLNFDIRPSNWTKNSTSEGVCVTFNLEDKWLVLCCKTFYTEALLTKRQPFCFKWWMAMLFNRDYNVHGKPKQGLQIFYL